MYLLHFDGHKDHASLNRAEAAISKLLIMAGSRAVCEIAAQYDFYAERDEYSSCYLLTGISIFGWQCCMLLIEAIKQLLR